MLYHILYPLSTDYTILNVFRYITFRSVWAMITALVLSILIGPTCIAWLKKIRCKQEILEYVVAHQSKSGTPTMGGVLIIATVTTSILLWADLTNTYIWLTMLVFIGFGIVGFTDDYIKVIHHHNKGLTAKAKFLFLTLVACIAIFLLLNEPSYSTKLEFPFFKKFFIDLGFFYLPFAVIVLVGTSNAVNLTDGLDGLAIMPTVIAAGVYAIYLYVTGNYNFAQYLQLTYIPAIGEVSIFCGALIGAGLGFLWYNAYPAQIFMGDVGSLSLGGVLGFIAVLCKQEMLLVIVGGLFVAETLSVILQVSYFKITHGKRIFKMAPLHHHFEMKGIPESKIIIRFWIISFLLGLAALSALKLR